MKRLTVASWLAVVASLAGLPGALGASGGARVPNVVVILGQGGINPAAITRSQGQFVLFILNRLPSKNETFTLVTPGASLGSAVQPAQPVSTDSLHDHTGLDLTLPPGAYHLQLTNHPQLSVLITITP
jgi:hypothetical protein